MKTRLTATKRNERRRWKRLQREPAALCQQERNTHWRRKTHATGDIFYKREAFLRRRKQVNPQHSWCETEPLCSVERCPIQTTLLNSKHATTCFSLPWQPLRSITRCHPMSPQSTSRIMWIFYWQMPPDTRHAWMYTEFTRNPTQFNRSYCLCGQNMGELFRDKQTTFVICSGIYMCVLICVELSA